ncbi:MAG: PTS lactose/cellobiose transporter subunit IIA [Erysipelotrichaceae bacterium]|nr:PTS lactose/cellobiose transporter subunit IIA [Erysipelotrichaceae bacterium]
MLDNTLKIVDYTIDSQEHYHQALKYAKDNETNNAKKAIKEGDNLLLKANQIHAQLLSQNKELDLLLIHAEDMLISAQLYKTLIKELMDLYNFLP